MKILIVTVSAEMEMKRNSQIQFLIGDSVQLIEENCRRRVKVFLNFLLNSWGLYVGGVTCVI